jgi:ABC-type Zn uptake system ZnuABC Zn-binding protein ZnuA
MARFARWALLAALVLLAGCEPAALGGDKELIVVATNSVLADLAQNVAGDRLVVRSLVAPGQDTHDFQPAAQDMVALEDARLILANGLGFEPWLEGATSGSQATPVIATGGIEAIRAPDGSTDPHVWQDVAQARRMVANIQAALSAVDPEGNQVYAANAAAYDARLAELDEWIVAEVERIPADQRKLVTSHDTLGYFARRYGFTVVGSALRSTTTEAADPSAAEIAALIDEIRAAGVPAIFAENVYNPGLMDQISAEAGVRLAPPLYTDALGPAGSPGATFLEMMRYNVTTIVAALAP